MPNDVTARIGVCSWSLQPQGPKDLVDHLVALGLTKLQLGLDPIREDAEGWAPLGGMLDEAGIALASAQFGAIGEDYSSPQTIRQTGGFVPTPHWQDNLHRIQANLAIAQSLGVSRITTHAGFIPQDPADPSYDALVQRVRTIADLIRQTLAGEFLLETGQETAATLSGFLAAVDRPNVGVNFDPANMLLYAMGDPMEAVKRLLPHIRQVHIKDAIAPEQPGTWGQEVAVGTGQVDWPAFLKTLIDSGYRGDWIIEREAGTQRAADITQAREVLKTNLA